MTCIILTEDYPPAPGGIAQWARGVARSLAIRGHRVTVVTRLGKNAAPEAQPGIRIARMPAWQWINLRLLYLYGASFFNILRERPDVIIATTWQLAAIVRPGQKLFGYRLVTVYHGLEVTKKLPAYQKRGLLKTARASALNIAVSHFTRDQICQKLSLPAHLIQVVHNGVDLERFKPGAPPADLLEKYNLHGRRVLLTLSRVIERKGHDIVIRALPSLIGEHPKLLYLIAGAYHQDFYDRLRELIAQLGLENHVRFTGRLEDERLADIYNLSELYIMVSKGNGTSGNSEGFGITYLEANACEKAVIGSDVDGIPDAVEDGVNGLLVPPNDIEATAGAVGRLLREDALRDKLGRDGRKRIEQRFTWDKITGRILDLLENTNE